jgi:hypothetical protein
MLLLLLYTSPDAPPDTAVTPADRTITVPAESRVIYVRGNS